MILLEALLEASRPYEGTAIATGARVFSGFAHDSRTAEPGTIFVALRTAKADGHEYIADAVARGATGVLCERLPCAVENLRAAGVTAVRVTDVRAVLAAYAARALARSGLLQIVIAGAVGKSSARHAIMAALGNTPDLFTNGDRNDELGLPLALGGLGDEHRIAVLEAAAATGGELERLARLLRPQVLVLTAAGPPNATDAPSRAFAEGLPALLAALAPDGTLIVNAGDPELAALLQRYPPPGGAELIRYGLEPASADVSAALLEGAIAIQTGGGAARCRLAGPGRGLAAAALAGIACALALGRQLDETARQLDGLAPLPGRLAPLDGREGLRLLDDTVSATPLSLALALETLQTEPPPHAAVLGEISGLPALAALPEALVRQLLALDLLVLQGRETAALARELRARTPHPERIVSTYSARDSADAMLRWAVDIRSAAGSARATVLIKGSDAARLERVTELLLAHDELATSVLIRQDEGWKRRTYVPTERPTWVEIDLDAIRHNLREIQRAAGDAEVMAVLKADAYGHGARWVARTVTLNGAAMLGVASLNEALDLRADGIAAPILILGYAPPWQGRDLALSDIHAAIFSLSVAEQFSRAATDLGRRIAVHVKIDTGMTRLGVMPEEAPAFVERLARLPGLEIVGIFTHLATADSDPDFAHEQGERFGAVLDRLEREGHRFRYIHVENSAAVLRGLPFRHTMVRAGLALYGLYPLPQAETDARLRPALAWKTRVAQVKAVPAGTSVSYGRSFVTSRPSRIAVLPVGYGDGFRRSPANAGQVLVRGRRAPIVGVVNMDMTMIDVTDIPDVCEGDEAVLIGRQGAEEITAEDVAAALGTISYEVVTQIMPRVPRQTR